MTNQNYEYRLNQPRRILFGANVSNCLCDELPEAVKSVLLVTGTHLVTDGTAERIEKMIRDSGRSVFTISGVAAEPPLEDVDRVVISGRAFHAEAVVALGGGSVIDTGKAAAALIPLDGQCADYFFGKKTIPGKGAFFAALPTTAGTGAEMTSNSVLTDTATQVKKSLRSPFMAADAALVDPVLTYSCSPGVTAASGLDAFVQSVEAYTNPKGSAYTKSLALSALKKIYFNLRTAYREPRNETARSEVAEGSMLAGMAFAPCGLGGVHGIAHPLGALLHVPHGIACAVLMPSVFRFNMAETDYSEVAKSIGCATTEEFIVATQKLLSDLNVPEHFQAYGLHSNHFDFILKNCRSGSMKTNPRMMTDEDVISILKRLM